MTCKTYEQHAARIRELELKLEIAQYGMGMPYDAERVRDLRKAIDDACEAYAAAHADYTVACLDAVLNRMKVAS